MKFLLLIAATLISASAFGAEVMGRAQFTVWSSHSTIMMDLRHEGDRILGQTGFGRLGMVNLALGDITYKGVAGGNSLTNLKCAGMTCSGIIGGKSTRFTISATATELGDTYHITGHVNHRSFTLKMDPDMVDVSTWTGSMHLKRTESGAFEGRGTLGYGMNSLFTAQLKTSGTMKNMGGPVLAMIFLVGPLAY